MMREQDFVRVYKELEMNMYIDTRLITILEDERGFNEKVSQIKARIEKTKLALGSVFKAYSDLVAVNASFYNIKKV